LAGSDDDDDNSDDDDEYGDGHSWVDGSDAGPSYYVVDLDLDDSNSVHVGLRVYTHKDVPVEIESRLG
jgi:hypothetical protein